MALTRVVGIDVGGERKGFHLAAFESGASEVQFLAHCLDVAEAIRACVEFTPRIIAIDCPPRCSLLGERTRLAERQLHKRGIRVQWTRRQTHEPADWMKNGQRVWDGLRQAFPNTEIIETFPTAATPRLSGSRLQLPLRLLGEFAGQRDWKDFVDAAICADVADRYLRSEAEFVGVDEESGEVDELGRIWY